MKTLLVDIDQAMLEHCVARVGTRQQLAIATSKAQAMMQLRHGPGYDVIVVCERLEDGSGLALLDEVQHRWPNLARVFCTDKQRLAMIRTRLAAFRLRHVLLYPIKPVKLELMLLHLAHAKHASTIRLRPPVREG